MQHLNQLYALTKRNVIIRYKHSILGFLWGFLKPLLYLLIFIVIFSSQFSSVNHYVLYATSGILFWFFFSNITSQGIQSIIGSSGIIKSIYIPPAFFPLAEVLSELVNLLMALVIYFILMYSFGMKYTLNLLWTIPILGIFALFTYSLTLLLSALNVYFRDVGILWNTLQPALFYLTPIAYTEDIIPSKFKFIIQANPIYYYIKLFRYPLYQSVAPDMMLLLKCSILSVTFFAVSFFIFNRLKNQFIPSI